MRQNKKDISEEIELVKEDELYISIFLLCASENIMMCSCKAKKTKNVYLLPSMLKVDRVQNENPKDAQKQCYFKMKPKEELKQLIKYSRAIELKQRQGNGL